MGKYRHNKNVLYVFLIILFTLCFGVGYAILTEQLKVNNYVTYDAMKWNVGFTGVEAVDEIMTDIISVVSISDDKKTIYINCDFGKNTSSKECVAKADISNASTFKVKLVEEPNITYDSNLIKKVELNWLTEQIGEGGSSSLTETQVLKNSILDIDQTKTVVVRIVSNDLTVDMLPSQNLSIPISIQLDWQQYE